MPGNEATNGSSQSMKGGFPSSLPALESNTC